jgi:hypothetical protein
MHNLIFRSIFGNTLIKLLQIHYAFLHIVKSYMQPFEYFIKPPPL